MLKITSLRYRKLEGFLREREPNLFGSFKFRTGIFLILTASSYWVKILGQLYLVEVILLVYFVKTIFLNHTGFSNLVNEYFGYFKFLALSLIGLIVTDLIRGTDLDSIMKGFALIVFTAINLFSLIILTQNNLEYVISAIMGWAFGTLLGVAIQPSDYAVEFPWKFGVGYPITLLFMIYISSLKISKFRTLSLAMVLVSVDLLNGARSLAAITFIAVILSILRNSEPRNMRNETSKKRGRYFGILTLTLLVGIIYSSYSILASNGILGEDAQAKYNLQNSSSLGLLLSGRMEIVSEFIAISDSPIIGYGSYAPLNEKIRQKVVTTLTEYGINPSIERLRYGVDYKIPVHSCIFQFWLWFGILGIPFWVKMFRQCLASSMSRPILPIVAFLAVQGLWDIIFSPYAADRRIQIPLTIILLNVTRGKYLNRNIRT